MNSCNGRGFCFQQCGCYCYNDDDTPSEICTCGHRNHTTIIGGNTDCDIYCKRDCSYNCNLVECHNFRLCGKKQPQHILDCNNSMCINCAVTIGKIKNLNITDICPVCMENKDMIQISCDKHNLCIDCWVRMSDIENSIPLSCPLCRESIWKWKGK